MTENVCTSVTFEPPDYDSPAVLDALVRALTGQSSTALLHDMIIGKYDIYKEEPHHDAQ